MQDNPSAKALGLDLIHYNCDRDSSNSTIGAPIQPSDMQSIFTEKEVRFRMPIEELKVLLEEEEEDQEMEENE